MANEKRLRAEENVCMMFNRFLSYAKQEEHKTLILDMKQAFLEILPVDAVPAVHGHWISKGYKIECSVCGHRSFLGTHDPVIHTEEKNICKYCHNCGAKMDGETG